MYVSSLDGTWDTIKSAVTGGGKAVVSYYGQAQRDAGARAALEAQMAAQHPQPAAGRISPTTLVLGGAAVVALVLLLRK